MSDAPIQRHDEAHLRRLGAAGSASSLRGPLAPIAKAPVAARRRDKPPPWMRIAGYVGLGLGCLLAAATTFLLVAAPVDLVRDRVVEQVKARTGRDLAIAGSASLTFFPRFGASLSQVSLAAPAEMGGTPLLTARKLDVELPFASLFSRRVVVRRLHLDGAALDLRVDAGGRRNWEFALGTDRPGGRGRVRGQSDDTAADVADARSARQPRNMAARLDALAPLHIRIRNASIRYADGRSGAVHELAGVDAELGLDEAGEVFAAKGDMAWQGEKIGFEARLSPVRAALGGEQAQLDVRVAGKPFELTYKGSLGLAGEPEFDGALSLRAASAQALPWLAKLRGTAAVEPLAVTSRVSAAQQRVALSELSATLGDSSLSGALTVETGGVRPYVRGSLQLSELDLARLLVRPGRADGADPIGEMLRGGDVAEKGARGRSGKRSAGKGWKDDVIDVAPLALADADLELTVDRLLYKEVATGRSRIALALKDKVAKLTLQDVQLYDGHGRGTLTLDGTGQALAAGVNLSLDRVSMLPLLEHALGFTWLDGRGRIALAVSGRGASERQIIETLAGKVEMSAGNGAIVGIDLARMLADLGQAKLSPFEANPRDRTPFSELAASFAIADGIAHSQDLRLVSPVLGVSGEGTANLGQRQVDYTVRPKIASNLPSEGALVSLAGLEVPVRIAGPWEKPTFTPDLKSVLGSEQAGETVRRVGKNLKSQEVQDAIRNLLGGGGDGQKVKPRDLLDKLLKKD